MSCVTSENFAVLINGEPSTFFHSGRGLRQGCPLSPLLLILAMEGLSLLLKKIQAKGRITWIKVSRLVKILHLFFVNDALILKNANLIEWKEISKIKDLLLYLGPSNKLDQVNFALCQHTCSKLGPIEDHLSSHICPPLHWIQVPSILH